MGAPEVPHGNRDTRSWKPAALLLTGHHAQASAVLDHSRTLPQGDGRAVPALAGGSERRGPSGGVLGGPQVMIKKGNARRVSQPVGVEGGVAYPAG